MNKNMIASTGNKRIHKVFFYFTFSTSAQAPHFLSRVTASLVLFNCSTLSLTTSGTSGIPSILCPLAITRAGTPVAAMQEVMAYLFCVVLTHLKLAVEKCIRMRLLGSVVYTSPGVQSQRRRSSGIRNTDQRVKNSSYTQ